MKIDYYNIEAGRKTDALIASKIFGLIIMKDLYGELCGGELIKGEEDGGYQEYRLHYFPNYSTDISAAWEIVEKLIPSFDFAINHLLGFDTINYTASIKPENSSEWKSTEAKTAPLAICKAALLVMENK